MSTLKISYDEKICVKCLACVSESEFGGVTYERGQLVFDETQPEDWQTIAEICPIADNMTRHPMRLVSA